MGAQESPTLQNYVSGGDLTANQFRFVSVAADSFVDQTGNGAMAAGVQQDNEANVAGMAVQVQTAGRTKVVAGTATVNAGDLVASDATGRAVLAATGDLVLGVARSDAVATGDRIDMDFFHGHIAL